MCSCWQDQEQPGARLRLGLGLRLEDLCLACSIGRWGSHCLCLDKNTTPRNRWISCERDAWVLEHTKTPLLSQIGQIICHLTLNISANRLKGGHVLWMEKGAVDIWNDDPPYTDLLLALHRTLKSFRNLSGLDWTPKKPRHRAF